MSAAERPAVDFAAAEIFLNMMRSAHAQQKWNEFAAARKMVALALGISDPPSHETLAARLKRR